MNKALPLRAWLNPRSRRTAPSTLRRALVISAIFGVLIYLGTQSGRDLMFGSTGFLQSSKGTGTGQPSRQTAKQPGEPADALRMANPLDAFPQKQVGRMLFTSSNSDICRRMLFDNRTGAVIEAGHTSCSPAASDAGDQVGQARAQTLLRSFRK
jgi:hypothetical protein